MPLRQEEDYGSVDKTAPYCRHCVGPDGLVRPYAEVQARMAWFLQDTQGISGESAREMAARMLADLPEWSVK